MSERLLITGGSGYLGAQLAKMAQEKGGWQTTATYLAGKPSAGNSLPLDLRDSDATAKFIGRMRPAVIIHQAVSNRNAEHVAAIVPAARNITRAARQTGARLVFVSTDMVFDGKRPPYHEDSPVSPVNAYGEAKAEAEDIVRQELPHAAIVRPSLIFGFDPIDKQTAWLLQGIEQGQIVRLFTDEIRCPVWVQSVAAALLEVAEREIEGILHIGGTPMNRWQFGAQMLECLNRQMGESVLPSTIGASGLARPADLRLDVSKAKELLATQLLSVREACRERKNS